MPYALCPMPYALCPMPYALCTSGTSESEVCPMPYALCPMPYALCPMPYARRVPHVTLERLYQQYLTSTNNLNKPAPTPPITYINLDFLPFSKHKRSIYPVRGAGLRYCG